MNKTMFKHSFIAMIFAVLFISVSFVFASCNKDDKTELLDQYITLSADSFVYSGQEIKPEVQVKFKDKVFVQGEDYVAIYQNNTNAGIAKVVISALDASKSLRGRIEKTFTIQKRDLNDVNISVSSIVFSGNPNALPPMTFKIGEKEFDKTSFDFQINGGFPNTQNTITITAKQNSNFSGSVAKPFVVDYMNLQDTTILTEETIYDGTAKMPQITIKMGDFILPNEVYEHLLIEYSNNINAGNSAKVNVSVKDENSFFEVNEQKESLFTISPANLLSISEIEPLSDYEYDGLVHKPLLVVTALNRTLTLGVDYDVLYYRGSAQISQDADFVDAGTITVRVVGKQNFCGSARTDYMIFGTDISSDPNLNVLIDDSNLVYNGYEQIPQIRITLDSSEIYSYQTTYRNNINAGTATTIITFNGNYAGTIERTFRIAPKAINEFLLELLEDTAPYSPNGATILCSLKEYDGAQELVLGQDYSLFYINNQSVSEGQNLAEVYAQGINNYSGQTAHKTFAVLPRPLTNDMASLAESTLYYNGTNKIPEVVVIVDGQNVLTSNYIVSYYQDESRQTPATNFVSSGQTIYVKITGTNNLIGETNSLCYTIEKGNIESQTTVVSLSEDEFLFDNTAKTPLVTSIMFEGNVLDNSNYDISYAQNVQAGTAQVIITGKQNMLGTFVKTFTILPRNISTLNITFKDNSIYNGQIKNITPTIDGEFFTAYDYDIVYFKVENGERTPLSDSEVLNLSSAGTYEIEVSGKQNFYGMVLGTTKIEKLENAIVQELKINNWEYGKNPEIPVMQSIYGTPLYYYALAGSNEFANIIPSKIGHYVCKAEVLESTNYFGITQTCEFEITKRNIDDAEIFVKVLELDGIGIVDIDYDVLVGETTLTTDDFNRAASLVDSELVISLTAKNSSLFVYGEKEWHSKINQTNNPQIICEDSYSFGDLVSVSFAATGQTATLSIYKETNTGYIEVQNNSSLYAGTYLVILKTNANNINFAQVVKKQFVVTPKQVNEHFAFYGFSNTEFNGKDVTKNFIIYDDMQNALTENIDYTLAVVGDRVNANELGIEVTVTFVGNYSGEIVKNFKITKQTIIDGAIVYVPYTGQTFGDNIQISGPFENEILYYVNKERTILATNEQKTNVGTIYGLIKSTEASVLDAKFEVRITKVQNEFLNNLVCPNFEYGDEITKPNITAKFGEAKILFAEYNKDTKTFGEFVEWTNEHKPSAFGTYAVKAVVLETDNYYELYNETILFSISRQELLRENITVTPTEFLYQEGTAQIPTITVLDKFGSTLVEGTNYSVKFFQIVNDELLMISDPNSIIDSGNYLIRIGGKGNYKSGSMDFGFEII